MQNKKQIISNIIIFILLSIITFIIIFKNYDFNHTIKTILSTDIRYFSLAVTIMFLYIVFESIDIRNIIKSLGNNISLFKAIKYTFIGFFFSGITPGGSGGQPMEIYYMKKDNIPVVNSTITLLIHLISFHTITIICGLIGLIINMQLITKDLIWIFIIGLTLKIIVLLIMLIALFSKKLSNYLIKIIIKILNIFKYKNLTKLETTLNKSLMNYHESAIYIKEHKNIFLKSLLIVFVQVIMYYSITYFIYLSFGLNTHNYLKIITIQALILVSTSSIPLPGAVGISENVFLKIYASIFPVSVLPSAMLLNRCLSFYLFIIISFIVVIFSSFKKKNNQLPNNML